MPLYHGYMICIVVGTSNCLLLQYSHITIVSVPTFAVPLFTQVYE